MCATATLAAAAAAPLDTTVTRSEAALLGLLHALEGLLARGERAVEGGEGVSGGCAGRNNCAGGRSGRAHIGRSVVKKAMTTAPTGATQPGASTAPYTRSPSASTSSAICVVTECSVS